MGGPGINMNRFLLRSAAALEQGVALSWGSLFSSVWLKLSDRFLMRQRIPFQIDFYVRQQGGGREDLHTDTS